MRNEEFQTTHSIHHQGTKNTKSQQGYQNSSPGLCEWFLGCATRNSDKPINTLKNYS
jgi:hypothetical protein